MIGERLKLQDDSVVKVLSEPYLRQVHEQRHAHHHHAVTQYNHYVLVKYIEGQSIARIHVDGLEKARAIDQSESDADSPYLPRIHKLAHNLLEALYAAYPEKLPYYCRRQAEELLAALDEYEESPVKTVDIGSFRWCEDALREYAETWGRDPGNNFAVACFEQNSINELIDGLADAVNQHPDRIDMKNWDMDGNEWIHAMKCALRQKISLLVENLRSE